MRDKKMAFFVFDVLSSEVSAKIHGTLKITRELNRQLAEKQHDLHPGVDA